MNTVKIINKSNNELPSYATKGSAGMDIRAYLPESIWLNPGETKLIPTGLYMELPIEYEAQIRSRSGLSLKNKVIVYNAPGTIDSDYRGEVGIILCNGSQDPYRINSGDRIAQMVIAKYEQINWNEVEELGETARQSGGYGSTGLQ